MNYNEQGTAEATESQEQQGQQAQPDAGAQNALDMFMRQQKGQPQPQEESGEPQSGSQESESGETSQDDPDNQGPATEGPESGSGEQESTQGSEGEADDSSQAGDQTTSDASDDVDQSFLDESVQDTEPTSEQPEGNKDALRPISEAVGVESDDPQEVKKAVEKIKQEKEQLSKENEELKENSGFANTELQQANDLAKNGGDWQSYLKVSSVDYDKIPDKTILTEGKLRNAFGDNQEKIQEYLETLSEDDLRLQAQDVREKFKQQQQQEMNQIQKQAEENQRKIQEDVRKAVDGLDKVAGIHITKEDKDHTYSRLVNNQTMQDMFFDENGNFNANKAAKADYIYRNINNILTKHVSKARNEERKKIWEDASNANPTPRKGVQAQPEQESSNPLDRHMKNLKGEK